MILRLFLFRYDVAGAIFMIKCLLRFIFMLSFFIPSIVGSNAGFIIDIVNVKIKYKLLQSDAM